MVSTAKEPRTVDLVSVENRSASLRLQSDVHLSAVTNLTLKRFTEVKNRSWLMGFPSMERHRGGGGTKSEF